MEILDRVAEAILATVLAIALVVVLAATLLGLLEMAVILMEHLAPAVGMAPTSGAVAGLTVS